MMLHGALLCLLLSPALLVCAFTLDAVPVSVGAEAQTMSALASQAQIQSPQASSLHEPALIEAKSQANSQSPKDDDLRSLEDAIAKLEKADKSFPSVVFSNGEFMQPRTSDHSPPFAPFPAFPNPGAPKNDFMRSNNINFPSRPNQQQANGNARASGVIPETSTSRDSDCSFELDGLSYNLNPLTLPQGHSEYMALDPARMIYKMNFCGVTSAPVRSRSGDLVASDCQRSNGMVCQYDQGPAPILEVIARWGAAPFPKWSFIDNNFRDAGVKLTFSNGDDCSFRGTKKTREAIVNFQCDKNVDRVGKISAKEISTCVYVFNVPTPYACLSAASSSGGGWWFILAVVVVAVLYFGGGYLYNTTKLQKSGLEAIPHLEFWKDLPALVKDGCTFTYSKIACYTCRQAKKDGDDL